MQQQTCDDSGHSCWQLLLPHHADLLRASAIAPEVIEARGYRSIDVKARLKALGFSQAQCRVPALLIPSYGVDGELVTYQIRPDEPRLNSDGKTIKYETVASSSMALDIPKKTRPWLADPARPLFITEGVRKADAAVSKDLCCIALLGVWNWRGTNDHGGKMAIADWESVALNGRDVYVVFDSDVMVKRPVYQALARLKGFLEHKGAHVWVIYLPMGDGGAKVGVDDYFAAGRSVQDLLALATPELREPPADDLPKPSIPYRATPHGLVWLKGVHDGVVSVPLTNFIATIVTDILEDDGVEVRRRFEIETTFNGRTRRFAIAADRLSTMSWVTEHLGAMALVYPGITAKDHARAAIQLLSEDITEQRVFTHVGWRRNRRGLWFYCHGGGVLGGAGHVPNMEVILPDGLKPFMLPDPPTGTERVEAVRASIAMLDLAPDRITIPLWGAVWRAVVGDIDFSEHVAGPTGAGKTELAALLQQHFGPSFDARHLPGSWASTSNALEALAFAAKDAMLVIDDFAPGGTSHDVARMHRDADRVLRAQGNRSGRQRMNPDASLKPAKPPRCLIISTGEDVPRGQSLRARILVIEVAPGDLDWERLTQCQRDAADGLYAQATGAFIQWLAPRYEQVRQGLRSEIATLRAETYESGQHRRTPEIVANLAVGVKFFLQFAQEVAALTMEEREALWNRCWTALRVAAATQEQHQAASEPTRRFLDLLAAALASGRAHVASPNGDVPEMPEAWGWRQVTIGSGQYQRDEWQAQGKRIGWVDKGNLYLEPEGAYAEAQALAREQGDTLAVSVRTLHKRLHERCLLVTTDQVRQTYTTRHTIEGVRRSVLHLHAKSLWAFISSQPDQADHRAEDSRQKGDSKGTRSSAWSDSDPHPSPNQPRENSDISKASDQLVRLVRSQMREKAPGGDNGDVSPAAWSSHLENPTGKPTIDGEREVFDL